MRNDDADPVGIDQRAEFVKAAVAAGLIRPGDPLDQNVVDFAHAVVELCASIGDHYKDPDTGCRGGEEIRAVFGTG
ncbi:hypothetical protein LJR290_007539 [Variovorax sp. LjRoot290]|uniref:hypothetical protein n=1 Tax=Variovorax sp. LjRoot290 TaxID=3342316 RepID=UPI003ED14898